jgi:hypothetical protein
MLHLSIGLAVAGALDGGKPVNAQPPQRAGRYALSPATPVRSKFRRAALVAGLWMSVGAAACGHYFAVAEPPFGRLPTIASSVYFAVGLIPSSIALYYWRLTRRAAEAAVSIDVHPPARGQPLGVKVSIDLAGGGRVDEAVVALVCQETYVHRNGGKRTTSTRLLWEDRRPFACPQDVMSDRALSGEATFAPPADQPPSSPAGQRFYPKVAWKIEVNLKQDGPDYRAAFPVHVS